MWYDDRVEEMTVAKAAAELHVTEQAVRKRIREGVMQAERFGAQWAIPRAEVERWKAIGKRKPGPPKRRHPSA